MNTFHIVMLVLAAVCFLVAAVASEVVPKVNLLALGLLFWVVVPLTTLVFK